MKKAWEGRRFMFWVGIVLVAISAILLWGGFMGVSALPMVLGVMGIVFIGASKLRLLK